MKRLTVSSGCLEMNTTDGDKTEPSGVDSDGDVEEDFGMRSGRRAASDRYNMKPPSLSPPPFTNLPDKAMASLGGNVFATASWWHTDQTETNCLVDQRQN